MRDWVYYNHAFVPACAPHEVPDLRSVESGEIWFNAPKGIPLLARWTTDFDCGYDTGWWYVIKDTPFDISSLKAKRRYEIRKGCRNFQVRQLKDIIQYADELYDVQVASFSAYPEKYRPTVDREKVVRQINNWESDGGIVYGAFSHIDGRLCGYAYLSDKGRVLHFFVLKTRPDYESLGVNAAIIYQILMDFSDRLANGCYICDGARSIIHETAFQAYLEKYFGFRKAFCKLHVEYNPKVKWLLLLLFRFRRMFQKLDNIGIVHSMMGVFLMQEIIETQEEKKWTI